MNHFYNSRKDQPAFKKFFKNLNDSVILILADKKPIDSNKDSLDKTDNITNPVLAPPEVKKGGNMMQKVYYAMFFIGGIILAWAFQFISRRSVVPTASILENKKQERSLDRNESAKDKMRIADLLKENESLQIKNAQFIEQISKLNTEKEQLKSVDTPSDPVKVVIEENSSTKEWNISTENKDAEIPKESYNSVLYFSTPNTSAEFRGGTPVFDEGASIYKFSLISATEATFEFCENKSSVGLALNHRNEHILVAAEESNAFNPNASKIAIDGNHFGKAVFEGTFWKLTKKAKIKYL